MPNFTGHTLGRYRILKILGEGGMATVYEAQDTSLERTVAVKVIRTDLFNPQLSKEEMLQRFRREAKILAKLSHPSIVDILDYGEHKGIPYFVIQNVPGGTLRQKMGHPTFWQYAVKFLLPIARSLDYAHNQGVMHRDITPSNILLNEAGEPVLSDFGLAKLLETIVPITETGMTIGTPGYMPPEQAMGKKVDKRADVYAFGVVLYEMITGRKPYSADNSVAILYQQINYHLPSPREIIPDLPEGIEKILHKALAIEPEDRYQDIGTMVLALENLLAEQTKQAFIPIKHSSAEMQKMPLGSEPSIGDVKSSSKSMKTQVKVAIIGVAATILVTIIGSTTGIITTIIGSPWVASILTPKVTHTIAPISTINSQELAATSSPLVPSPLPSFTDLTATSTKSTVPTLTTPVPTETKIHGALMRLVQKGNFIMGFNATEAFTECAKYRSDCLQSRFVDEQPPHIISLNSYYIDKFEVTNALYRDCVNAGICQSPKESISSTHSSYYGNSKFDNFPVIYVDWNMARTYCEWRGGRLPTEAEWEIAAHGADGRTYPWGEGLDCDHANYGKISNTCKGDTTAVGSYDIGQSPYGIYDMAGNVSEWVADWYQYDYYTTLGSQSFNPQGSTTGDARVLRGGSWSPTNFDVRSTNRDGYGETFATDFIGFRCALTP